MTISSHDSAWQLIEAHPLGRLDALFVAEPDRLNHLTRDVAGLHFDWSKTHLDPALIDRFVELADVAG